MKMFGLAFRDLWYNRQPFTSSLREKRHCMGLRRGVSQSRNVIRAISILVIVATIPLYILGIGAWAINGGRSTIKPTFTPLGGVGDNGDSGDGGFATFTPLGGDVETDAPSGITPFASATISLGGTFVYSTIDTGGLFSPTPPPTFYIPPTAAPTLVPTNTQALPPTPVVRPTDVIVPTQPPPLIPPTDTPTV
jgi:hypothetical protein